MTVTDIEDALLQLLAEDSGQTVPQVRAGLEAAGGNWPIDSLLLVEVAVRIEAITGVTVTDQMARRGDLTSVKALAAALHDQVNAEVVPA